MDLNVAHYEKYDMKDRVIKLTLAFLMISLSSWVFALEIITVSATKYPNEELLNKIRPILAKQGYDLEIKSYASYNDPGVRLLMRVNPNREVKNPNKDVIDMTCDANFFQHKLYLDKYNKDFGTHLASVGEVFYVPYQIYPNKLTQSKFIETHNLKDIKKGATVGIPDSEINEARALKLLAAAKMISLDSNVLMPTTADITANPYNLIISKIDSVVLGQMIKNNKVDFIVMNSVQAGLEGVNTNKYFLVESQNSVYANVLVTRKDNVNNPKIQALFKALTSPEAKNFIQTKLIGVIPAF